MIPDWQAGAALAGGETFYTNTAVVAIIRTINGALPTGGEYTEELG